MSVSRAPHRVQHRAMRTTRVVAFGSLFVAQICDSRLKRNSNHKLERRDDPFKLRENGTNGFGAETQSQPQTILKSILKSILKCFWKNATKTQNGLWCQFFCENVNIPKHQTRSITMKTVELDNDNVKHNEIQWTENEKHRPISLEMRAAGYFRVFYVRFVARGGKS